MNPIKVNGVTCYLTYESNLTVGVENITTTDTFFGTSGMVL